MPGFDGSGQISRGPMTGGGRGYCNPGSPYGFDRSFASRGAGFGYDRGRGYRHIYRETGLPRWARMQSDWPGPYREAYYSREDEIKMLKEEAEALKNDLNAIERRKSDLEAEDKPEE